MESGFWSKTAEVIPNRSVGISLCDVWGNASVVVVSQGSRGGEGGAVPIVHSPKSVCVHVKMLRNQDYATEVAMRQRTVTQGRAGHLLPPSPYKHFIFKRWGRGMKLSRRTCIYLVCWSFLFILLCFRGFNFFFFFLWTWWKHNAVCLFLFVFTEENTHIQQIPHFYSTTAALSKCLINIKHHFTMFACCFLE